MRKLIQALCFSTFSATIVAFASAEEFAAKDLANEEGKFAAYSVKNGMRAVSLEFFAAQSWLLRPDLVDAQAWIRGRPDPPIVIHWKSQYTILSALRDLGFPTGPSIFRRKADRKACAAHGQFFSIWQKQKNGDRKVPIDHGISHGPSGTPDASPTAPLLALDLATQKPDGTVHDAEQDFINRTNKAKSEIAYNSSVTSRAILLRNGQFPISGEAVAIAHLNSSEGTWSWTPKLQGASVANDFAGRLFLREKGSMMSP